MSEGPRRLHDSDEDAIDPELVRLRRGFPVGPILVASVLGFALLLMVRLRHDFVYAGRGDTPVDLGRLAAQPPALDNDSYVSFWGEPDARAPLRLRGLQDTGRRLAPVLGTAGRVWLNETGEAIDVEPRYDGRHAGRLRRLDDTAFGERLREEVAALPPVPRIVFPEALTAGALPDRDVHGEPVAATPATRVTVEERVPDAALVTLVETDGIGDEPTARRTLAAAGLTGKAIAMTDTSWTYEVAGSPDDARGKLRAARLFAAGVEPKVLTHEGKVAALRIDGDAVQLGDKRVARAALSHLTLFTPAAIPDDAWVLLSGDTPAALWYMRPLYGLLALIAIVMVWALVVDARHLRKQRADSPV